MYTMAHRWKQHATQQKKYAKMKTTNKVQIRQLTKLINVKINLNSPAEAARLCNTRWRRRLIGRLHRMYCIYSVFVLWLCACAKWEWCYCWLRRRRPRIIIIIVRVCIMMRSTLIHYSFYSLYCLLITILVYIKFKLGERIFRCTQCRCILRPHHHHHHYTFYIFKVCKVGMVMLNSVVLVVVVRRC